MSISIDIHRAQLEFQNITDVWPTYLYLGQQQQRHLDRYVAPYRTVSDPTCTEEKFRGSIVVRVDRDSHLAVSS